VKGVGHSTGCGYAEQKDPVVFFSYYSCFPDQVIEPFNEVGFAQESFALASLGSRWKYPGLIGWMTGLLVSVIF
jgi:hypothetical protein